MNDRDEESADSEGLVCIEACYLGRLIAVTGERIDFEDHGVFVVVAEDDLNKLRKLRVEIALECAAVDDDAH